MKRVLINHWLLIYVLIMLFFSVISKDDKDDNLSLVSKAFQNETPILEIENFFLCILAK